MLAYFYFFNTKIMHFLCKSILKILSFYSLLRHIHQTHVCICTVYWCFTFANASFCDFYFFCFILLTYNLSFSDSKSDGFSSSNIYVSFYLFYWSKYFYHEELLLLAYFMSCSNDKIILVSIDKINILSIRCVRT